MTRDYSRLGEGPHMKTVPRFKHRTVGPRKGSGAILVGRITDSKKKRPKAHLIQSERLTSTLGDIWPRP